MSDYDKGYADAMARLRATGKAGAELAASIEAVYLDELDPLPIEQAIAEHKRGEHVMGEYTPPTRDYSVMVRRPAYAYATMEVSAASAEQALQMAHIKADLPPYPEYEYDDAGPVGWMHAELVDIDEEPPDHADWEEPKLSPAKLVEALNKILNVQANANSEPDVMAQALGYIEDIARAALNETVPS